MEYEDFIAEKALLSPPTGVQFEPVLRDHLFEFQRDIVRWALKRGRAAVFADCGMGKTPMQLEWARVVAETQGPVLILAPLAVAQQTVHECEKFYKDLSVYYHREMPEVVKGITITNYEMLHKFDASQFVGVVLDESSILKSYEGATRTAILDAFAQTAFRLACTATPAPNDYMELGNHAQFVGSMSRTEMLSMFFVHDGGETQKWRLKGHAEQDFWRWMASWAVMIRKPSDLGYPDEGFTLPPITLHEHVIKVAHSTAGELFAHEASTLQERIVARRESVDDRVAETAALVNGSTEPWVVWCNLNSESDALRKAIPDAVEIRGSQSPDEKEAGILAFTEGRARVIVSKASMTGFGLNWQHCAHMAFVGLSDSWEQFYQATRRCWRFGQLRRVNVHLIIASTEGAVLNNIKEKDAAAQVMAESIVGHMRAEMRASLHAGTIRHMNEYERDVVKTERFTMHLGDCVEVVSALPADSIHFTIFSPPFASLYTYSASDRDMGNCKDDQEFYDHFDYLVRELYRVTMPGRLLSFHCMNLPTTKVHHGYIGIRDFRGEMIRLFLSHGWIFHSEVCIWKDPVTAMQRTKALGLLYKQLKKDSAMSRQGIPDYLVTMRKPGENPERVTKTEDGFPVGVWQNYASPVWMDINPSDTLQFRSVREHNDERHIAPLQLQVIQRAVELWTNPGDTVLSPFAGIGSEGHVALRNGRRFVGVELKRAYFTQAVANLRSTTLQLRDLFSE
jgi:superfamily II DNA or RNA helicase